MASARLFACLLAEQGEFGREHLEIASRSSLRAVQAALDQRRMVDELAGRDPQRHDLVEQLGERLHESLDTCRQGQRLADGIAGTTRSLPGCCP